MKPIAWTPLEAKRSETGVEYKYVSLALDKAARTATITVRAPSSDVGAQPQSPEELAKVGVNAWAVRAFRELDDALLELRFNQLSIGVVALKTSGDASAVLAVDKMLAANKEDGLVREVMLHMKRVLKRLDITSKSFFALVEPGSCFVGSLLELALASDRVYMLDVDGVSMQVSPLNAGPFPWRTASRASNRAFCASRSASRASSKRRAPSALKMP